MLVYQRVLLSTISDCLRLETENEGGPCAADGQPNPWEKFWWSHAQKVTRRQSTARTKRISTDCTGRWTYSQFGLGSEVCSSEVAARATLDRFGPMVFGKKGRRAVDILLKMFLEFEIKFWVLLIFRAGASQYDAAWSFGTSIFPDSWDDDPIWRTHFFRGVGHYHQPGCCL